MSSFFGRDEIALPGFARFFLEKSNDERQHGILCINYMSKRGGSVRFDDVKPPAKAKWDNGLHAMEEALNWEKNVNEIIIDMHKTAQRCNDPQFESFIENHFFNEQTDEIKQLANYIGLLRKVGPGLGEFEFDYEVLQKGEARRFASVVGGQPPNGSS